METRRHWACGCPIGSETCAYQNEPKVKENLITSPEKDFGWWWHLANKAVEQEVEVEDE